MSNQEDQARATAQLYEHKAATGVNAGAQLADNNLPAFPVTDMGAHGHFGMTLRDWFAGQALACLGGSGTADPTVNAIYAYEIADAMMKARNA